MKIYSCNQVLQLAKWNGAYYTKNVIIANANGFMLVHHDPQKSKLYWASGNKVLDTFWLSYIES